MSETGLALFVLFGFLLPVPILVWPRSAGKSVAQGVEMYVAHFAAGLAIKAREPRAPTWALLVAVGLLDILFGPFVLAGIERATVAPSESPGFSLDYIDWSHSLAMSRQFYSLPPLSAPAATS